MTIRIALGLAFAFSVTAFGAEAALTAKAPARKPASHCDVKEFGAKGDGKNDDQKAIQAAIDSCAKSEGQVDLHDGIFLTGMITLRSGIVFNVEPTATLKGTQNDADYPDMHPIDNRKSPPGPLQNSQLKSCVKALVYAENAQNVVIQGGGTIDGSGSNPKWTGPEATRPMAIFIVLSRNVTIQNVHVVNAGMWSVVNMENENVLIHGLIVHSPDGPTRDGTDVVDCHHVTIEDSEISSEDDSVCLKSGSPTGVYDVTVQNVKILQSSVANGLKMGTASSGSFRKIVFSNVQIQNVKQAAMAVESVDGAEIDDIHFNNIHFKNTGAAAYVILGRRKGSPGIGSISNVSFDGISGETNLPWGSAISGSADQDGVHRVQNVTFQNVTVTNSNEPSNAPVEPKEYSGQYPDPRLWQTLPAYGLFLRHVSGVSLTGTVFKPANGDPRKAIVQDDVSGFSQN